MSAAPPKPFRPGAARRFGRRLVEALALLARSREARHVQLMTAGYSGTPLAAKLSLRDGLSTWWENMPDTVRAEIEGDGLALELLGRPEPGIEAAHVFVTSRAATEDAVRRLLPLLAPSGFLWISWPKKASKVPTDVTEDVIREVALPLGLVDVKVCAVDSTWSGLKLMIRRRYR